MNIALVGSCSVHVHVWSPESVSCCGDMSMSRLTRDLNQNIEHATSFLTLFGYILLELETVKPKQLSISQYVLV